jgi:RimJ/RimL family protein N-acetyltransferase
MHDEAPAASTLPMVAQLRGGRQVTLRQIQAHDKAELQAAFQRLSAQSRYTRFMIPMRELSAATLETATHPVPGRDFALVALSGVGGEGGEGGADTIVAAARYVGAPGSDTCEFAVTVADDWDGLGLGGRLLAILVATATEHGLRCMEGYVLAVNTPMRRLARRLGFVDTQCEDDPTLRVMRRSLADNGCHD